MSKAKAPHPIEVEWVDSTGPAGSDRWIFLGDYNIKPSELVTRGFLVKETKTYVVIASSVHTDWARGAVMGVVTIPKVAITKRKDG